MLVCFQEMEFVQEEAEGAARAPGSGTERGACEDRPSFSHGAPTAAPSRPHGLLGQEVGSFGPRWVSLRWAGPGDEWKGLLSLGQSRGRSLFSQRRAVPSVTPAARSRMDEVLTSWGRWLIRKSLPSRPRQKIDLGLFSEHLLSSGFPRPSMELWGRDNIIWRKYGFCTL